MLKSLLVLLLTIAPAEVFAQGQDRFSTMEACVAAVKAGTAVNYIPSFMTARREPTEGEEVRPLEERACVDLRVVGGRGFIPQVKGEKYIFRGTQVIARYDCGNDAGSIEYIPSEIAAVPIAPSLPPAPEPVPALPMCRLTGSFETVYLGLALNGEGKFAFNGENIPHEKVDGVDSLRLTEAGVGTHSVVYTVTGPAGSVACESKFDIFSPITVASLIPTITIPRIGFCDTDRDGWRPDRILMGMVEKVRCHPGSMILDTALGGAAGWGATRIWPGPLKPHPANPVGKVPPQRGVISPP